MKLVTLFLLILHSAALFCQPEKHEVLASSGGSSSVNGVRVNWTMGETIINGYTVQGYSISQGFQRGLISVVTESGNLPDKINITAYPNPVLSTLTIRIVNSSDSYHWSVAVYDSKGVTVIQKVTETDLNEINFTSLPPGAYLVQIRHQGYLKTFNIIKQ